MSDTFDDLDNDEDPDLQPDPDDSGVIRDLRKQAKAGRQAARERDQLKTENTTLRNEKLLREAKLDSLKPSQQNAVLRDIEGEATVESLQAVALDLGFIEPESEGGPDGDAQEQMANAAATTNAGQHKAKDTLSAAEFNQWDMPRKQDFIKRHPDKFAALKRGESVNLSG